MMGAIWRADRRWFFREVNEEIFGEISEMAGFFDGLEGKFHHRPELMIDASLRDRTAENPETRSKWNLPELAELRAFFDALQ